MGEDWNMLIRLSSNRILNLAEVAEVRIISGRSWPGEAAQLFAQVVLLSGTAGRGLSACGAEATALQEALRAHPRQFAEVGSGHYINLDGILSANLTGTPEPSVYGWWRTAVGREPEFTVIGEAAVGLRDALATYLGEPFDPDPFAPTPCGEDTTRDAGENQDHGVPGEGLGDTGAVGAAPVAG
jgi:hypothetical protein